MSAGLASLPASLSCSNQSSEKEDLAGDRCDSLVALRTLRFTGILFIRLFRHSTRPLNVFAENAWHVDNHFHSLRIDVTLHPILCFSNVPSQENPFRLLLYEWVGDELHCFTSRRSFRCIGCRNNHTSHLFSSSVIQDLCTVRTKILKICRNLPGKRPL